MASAHRAPGLGEDLPWGGGSVSPEAPPKGGSGPRWQLVPLATNGPLVTVTCEGGCLGGWWQAWGSCLPVAGPSLFYSLGSQDVARATGARQSRPGLWIHNPVSANRGNELRRAAWWRYWGSTASLATHTLSRDTRPKGLLVAGALRPSRWPEAAFPVAAGPALGLLHRPGCY